MSATEIRNEYLALYLQKKEAEEQLESIKEKLTDAEDKLVKEFEKEGMQSVKIAAPDGSNRTLYLKRELWAKLNDGFEGADAIAALKDAGLADEYVKETYNSRSVTSFFRDREKNGEEPVPDELKGVFRTTEKYGIGVRKA